MNATVVFSNTSTRSARSLLHEDSSPTLNMINANSFLISLRIILSAVQIYKKSTAEAMDHISQWPLLLPPVLAVVEHDAFALLSVLLLEERDLISESELDELRDMQMALHRHLGI